MNEVISRHYKTIMITGVFVLILVMGIVFPVTMISVARASLPESSEKSKKIFIELISPAMTEILQPMQDTMGDMAKDMEILKEQNRYENDASVILLSLEVEGMKTGQEVDERINFLVNNRWLSQIAALKILSNNAQMREALNKKIVYEPVRLALMAQIMSR